MRRFALWWSLLFVLLRAVLLIRWGSVGSVFSCVACVSEFGALVMTCCGLYLGRRSCVLSGLFVPVAYLVPLLFDLRGAGGVAVLAYYVTVIAQWAIRVYMLECCSVGVPVFVRLLHSGPFALVRHPLMAVDLLGCCCMAVALPSCWNFGVLVVCAAAALFVVMTEERLLSQEASYRGYAGVVKFRLCPGVW